ncbi:hypothetical protein [Burkholderia sp. USMB20]|uniref:hypothetical protein n=1 Tax=Burkholderia sp. USMB20 TaxID=1571773 RepID=UPI000A9306DF|nr:hypothetical protein [Burkholderia sp. USMB20]TGN95583.1 hypothetical protein PL79_020965 [Burkholderia sp. USMB20]
MAKLNSTSRPADVAQLPTVHRAKGRRRTRPIAGQPLAPVLRLVANENHRKPQCEVNAGPQKLYEDLCAVAQHIIKISDILCEIKLPGRP